MAISFLHSAGRRPPVVPAPGWAWRTETAFAMPAAKQLITIPSLATCQAVTLFLVFRKNPTAEDLHMVCSFPTAEGREVDLVYAGRTYAGGYYGYGYNAYDSGFITTDPYTYLDGGVLRLQRATIQNNTVGGYATWFNGVYFQGYGRAGGQYPARTFTDKFFYGGDYVSGFDWQGDLLAGYLYTRPLTEADCQQTEAYLRGKFAGIT